MVLKLYGYAQSTCTRRVAATLHEKKVPYELVVVDLMKGEHKSPEYLKIQPFGQIPYIVDDGFVLYESRAISRYIATKYASQGAPLIPTEPKENALFEQAVSTEQSNFDAFASPVVAEKVFKPYRGLTPDQAVVDSLLAQLAAKLDAYEVILGKQAYLAGDQFTLADLFHLPYGSMLAYAGSNLLSDESRPNVVRWWNDITSRPSWVAVKDGVSSNL